MPFVRVGDLQWTRIQAEYQIHVPVHLVVFFSVFFLFLFCFVICFAAPCDRSRDNVWHCEPVFAEKVEMRTVKF